MLYYFNISKKKTEALVGVHYFNRNTVRIDMNVFNCRIIVFYSCENFLTSYLLRTATGNKALELYTNNK